MKFLEKSAEPPRAARAQACRSASCVLAQPTVLGPLLSPLSLRLCLHPLTRIKRRTLRTGHSPMVKIACQTPMMLHLAARRMARLPPRLMLLVHPSPLLLSLLNNLKLVHHPLTVNTRPNLLQRPQLQLFPASAHQRQNREFLPTTALPPTTRSSSNNSSSSRPAREAPQRRQAAINTLSREPPSHSLQATTQQTMPLSVASQSSLFNSLLNKLNLLASNTLLFQHKARLLPPLLRHHQARLQHLWDLLQERLKAETSVSASTTSTSLLYSVRVTLVRLCLPRRSSRSNSMPSRF